jgi:hypothetical protein
MQILPNSLKDGSVDANLQHYTRELLYLCESIGDVDEKTVQQAFRFANDFRVLEKI